jgi:tetratricopeptide (TPR) repeat protein
MTDIVSYLRFVADAQQRTDSGEWAEAAALWQQVVECNPVNGSYWDYLAEARYETGEFQAAIAAYEKVLELGAWGQRLPGTIYPAEVAYRIACCHLRAGDREPALDALSRALSMGFRDLDRPRADPLWESLRAEDAVRDMLGIIDAGRLSREEGWRADLAFLAREVKRRARVPRRDFPDAQFDPAVAQLAAAVPGLSDAQVIVGMLKLLSPLGDGHAFIAPAEGNQELNQILPVKFYLFPEGLFATAAIPRHRQLLGAQVLTVGDLAADQALTELDPLISRDNTQQVRWLAPEVLRWPPVLHALGLITDPGSVMLTVQFPDGRTSTVTVDSEAAGPRTYPSIPPPPAPNRPRPPGWISLPDTLSAPLPLYLRNTDIPYWFDHLPGHNLVYFQFNGVGDHPAEPLAAFCERLFRFIDRHQVSKLVIDLRWNGGGNTYLSQPLLHHLIASDKVSQPGGLYVIIGRGTFSAAQNTATAIGRETSAIFVGEPSGSRPNFTGEAVPFQLPYSKTTANVGDLYWQTSWPMDHRPWIAPDLYTPPTFEAYSQNRDPAMEAILTSHEHLPGR